MNVFIIKVFSHNTITSNIHSLILYLKCNLYMLTALTKAGKNNEAVNFLEQLAENAVNEQR